MQAIILAAGSGKRFKSIMGEVPKCLLKINGVSILERLISQITSFDIKDIKIVVGYKKDKIIKETSKFSNIKITIVENERYKDDVNILSLTLALKLDISPCYIFEADCVFDEACFDLIFDTKYKDKSVWYSIGNFTKSQYGGIIGANVYGEVFDVNIVREYKNEYENYKKMIGVLKVGPKQIKAYCNYLFKSCDKNIKQYYHIPWIENLSELTSYLVDLGDLKAESFNTVDAYYKVKEMFENETGAN